MATTSTDQVESETIPQASKLDNEEQDTEVDSPSDENNDKETKEEPKEELSELSKLDPDEVIRFHEAHFKDRDSDDEKEVITIYCRTRKTTKKAAGGTGTMLATGGTLALCGITGGLGAPLIAMGTIGVAGTSYYVGGEITGYLVNPRVMRFDFDDYAEANEAFRQIGTYKLLIRDGEIAQSMGKMRWVAELVGVAITDESERGPTMILPESEEGRLFNILRSPLTYGASKVRWSFKKFSIKQYTTDFQETAEEKWKKISSMNSAILLCGTSVEKTYGKAAYVNELLGWYVVNMTLPEESKNKVVIVDLDEHEV